jgi:hypothetical protein
MVECARKRVFAVLMAVSPSNDVRTEALVVAWIFDSLDSVTFA